MINAPPTGLDSLIVATFNKGESSGIELFTKIPAVALDDFESQLNELKERVKDGTSND